MDSPSASQPVNVSCPLTVITISNTYESLMAARERLARMTPAELLESCIRVQVSEQDDPGPDTQRPWR